MAITEEQRTILIERLKKAQAAKAAKKAARDSAAAPVAVAPATKPVAPATKPVAPATKPAKAAAKAVPVPAPEPEPEQPEPEPDVPEPTPIAAELYKPVVKASQPIDIPAPKAIKKAGKDKGYMKLKFYTQPTPKVLKKLMAIHDDTSSEEEESDEEPVKATHARFTPVVDDAKKLKMKEMADFYFNYY